MITDYTPTVDEVASLVPSRAAGRWTGGAGEPAFPDTARVEAIITDAVGLIAPSLGGNALDEQFYTAAKALIKLQVALLLEPSAWPEQARPEKSAYSEWSALLNSRKADLEDAIIRFRDESESGVGSSAPVFSAFPPPGLQQPGAVPLVNVSLTGEIVDEPGNAPWGGWDGFPPYGSNW